MSLTKSRKILSVLLSFLIAIGGIMFFGAEITEYTLCNENYMTKVFSSNSLASQCRQNFDERIEVISAKSGIPSRVFEAVFENNAPGIKTAVQRMFSNNNAYLYSEDLVSQFEELCTEYLDGNQISYNKTEVHNAAEYAALVYSDCFGIQNSQEIMSFVEKVDAHYGKYASAGLLFIAVATAMFLIIYSRREDTIRVISTAFTALGASLFLIGICGIIFGFGNSPMLSPQIYSDALARAVDGAFSVAVIIGAIITAAAFTGSYNQYKKNKNQLAEI